MASLPDSVADTALARLFAGHDPSPDVVWFSLPGGQHLYDAGSTADEIFFLRAGRLGVIRHEEGQEPQFLGVIRPGEPVGEMGLLAGAPHSATVVALRDSEILALPRKAFFAAIERDPAVMIELARLMIQRTRQTSNRMAAGEPSVFGLVGISDGIQVRELAERLADCIEAQGYVAVVMGVEAMSAPTEWFSNVEADHDFVIYAAETADVAWRHLVGRQVDRLFLVGRGDAPPPPREAIGSAEALERQRLVDLVLIQPANIDHPQGSEAWLDAVPAARLFHIRRNDDQDRRRLARTLTGRSVGLVFSGGGARAYAHIGAVKALRAANVPIDYVGGSSMGGIIAAGVAKGWDDAELDRRIRKAFVESSPVDDIALPLIAMIRGEKVKARLEEHFGDSQIADLWLPFFCVSSNLTSGSYQLHRRGLLSNALRASISLPGVMPPVSDGANVLVDGAVMKNFPADIMRSFHLGPIVGVDVTRGRSITADDVKPESVWRWIFSGHWRRGPPLVSLLMRAATVSTGRDLAASREATDVLVTPKLERIEIRNWDAYDPAVEAGERAMTEALAKLHSPVTELRRRQSLAERAEQRPARA
ncbi:patatin-like phospholipase family protein [soil metagenome]